ncbi:MAG: methylmalonyl Co-A mutase-associated GTPase MeaB [Pseudonocardiales bacterium]|nr:methylmalonyl Co-A mutase-associated GTPase MeaB [Pseudonocardiales bacterium]MBV9652498.1 methylmalonyl Co-A mutase-associated GTPase MeaB [Pseudonocardiales bacterium]
MSSRSRDIDDLVVRARQGQARAVGRLISLIEDGAPELRALAAALARDTGRAQVVGITGPPGVGKSTMAGALVAAFRAAGKRVGVLAVDPSSPFSGGALLGDRVRMQEHATDPEVFIRSMATRGHLGGIAWATPQALRVLAAAGYTQVLVETVGVGQSEVEVMALADTTVVVLAPGMGDGVQAAKAGILEVADILVVNKADREGAEQTVRELQHMISLGRREVAGPSWRPPIVCTTAHKTEGIDDLVAAIDEHRAWMLSHGELDARRQRRAEAEVEAIALAQLHGRLGDVLRGSALPGLAKRVVAGDLDVYRAADELIAELTG